jgi:hypothetical protein
MRVQARRKNAPDAADVFSDLVRVRTLELGELRGAFDLEEYLIPGGRDKLDRANLVSAPVSPTLIELREYARLLSHRSLGHTPPTSLLGAGIVLLGSFVGSKCDGVNLGKMMKVSNTGFSSLSFVGKANNG